MMVGVWKAPALQEQLDRRVVQEAAVLDRVDAVRQRRIDAARAVGMRRDPPAQHVRGLDDGAQLVGGELLVDPGADVGEHPAGRRELDRVGALRHLQPHRPPAAVDAVADADVGLHAGADILAKAVGLAVPAGRRQDRADRQDARAGDLALGHRLAQRVDDLRLAGAQVAHGGEAGFQRQPGPMRAVEPDLGIGILDEAQPLAGAELHGQVYVAVDQARQHEAVLQVDQRRARRRIDEAGRHRGDPAIGDADALLRRRRLAGLGEQPARMDDDLALRRHVVCPPPLADPYSRRIETWEAIA